MKKDVEFFTNALNKQILKIRRLGNANIPYGSNVMPILEMYKELSNYEERKAFQDALEAMLTDIDEGKRHFAVDVCLGFVLFKDAI